MEDNIGLPITTLEQNEQSRIYNRHPCKGCFHWRGESFGSICCNYIFDEGHRRPCPPGQDCTVRRERGPLEMELLREIQKSK